MKISNVALCDERIIYEAIWRHVDHLSQIDWDSADAKLAASIAAEIFPQLGYPVPGWITELAG